MTLNDLIKEIIPYYNFHRKNQSHLYGTEALENIWEVGDLIKKYLYEHEDIAPHALYREIYGKSEQNKDITQKSYITRDFLDRAYRVRRIFTKKQEIKKRFPTLQRYRLFYKSMPFFDDGRFSMNKTDQLKLEKLLNSTKSYKTIISEVENLKNSRIGLKISRDSKLQELEKEKQIFVLIYNEVFGYIKKTEFRAIEEKLPFIKELTFIKKLSQSTGALSSDQLKMTSFDIPDKVKGEWLIFSETINMFAAQQDAKIKRRFRRLIPPERMVRLSEMLYALTDEQSFNNLKAK